MQLRLVRHLWGVDLSRGFSPYIAHWKQTGYDMLEAAPRVIPDAGLLRKTLREEKLDWVGQIFSNMFVPGGTVKEHLDSLRQQVEECLDLPPLFFNCHSGSDAWSEAEAEDFYGGTLEMEKQVGIPLAHETHRSRYFFNPWNTGKMLVRFPELRLTCDYSHWVCVTERLLAGCEDILTLSARHCWHLHARVGYAEGPQVSDPRAPEWKNELDAHEQWWSAIWRAQAAAGRTDTFLAPEFGPPHYMHTLPFTQAPVADLNAICDWMALRQRERFLQGQF
jgi:hypothetical protein